MSEYPSYRIRRYPGSNPAPVWDILVKMPQVRFIFKDQTRHIWCQLPYMSTSMRLESGHSPLELMPPPLVDLLANGDLGVILSEEPSDRLSAFFEDTYREGRLVTVTHKEKGILHAILGEGVVLAPLFPQHVIVYDAAERLMQDFRAWELEDSKGLEVAEQISEERVSRLRVTCKEMTRKLLAEEPGLEDAVVKMLGEGGEGRHLWVIVATWFDHVGELWRVEEGTMWCVD